MRWSFPFSPQGSVLIGSTFWGPRWLFLMGSWPGSTFFYLSTINSQWSLNRVSCSKKEKMADGLCQWNIGIQVDRASSPFVFLNAPFYTKGGAEQPPFEFLTFIWCVASESHADMKDSSYRIEVYGPQFPWSALIRLLGEGQRMNERVRGGPKRLCSSADLISLPFVSLCAW